jgi:hypothetical protein
MLRFRTAVKTVPLLAALLAGCVDSDPLPTALDAPNPSLSVEPILVPFADAVITSSAFDGARPALEEASGNLPRLSELPGGELSGEVVDIGGGCEGDPLLGDPAGAIALVETGRACPFRDAVLKAHDAGAIGVVLYRRAGDNEEQIVPWSAGIPIPIPGVMVPRSTGLLVREGLAPVTAVIRPLVIEDLADAVRTLGGAGVLNHGQTTSLLMKLELAERHTASGNVGGARGVLRAFISQVEALVADGVLAPSDGNFLIRTARALIAALAA